MIYKVKTTGMPYRRAHYVGNVLKICNSEEIVESYEDLRPWTDEDSDLYILGVQKLSDR